MSNEKKIRPISELEIICSKFKNQGKKIVLCHGTFDLLHIGHLRYLKEAKKSGDLLIVTITADKFVLKGPGRPIFNENFRSEMLANLEIIDFVSIINDKSALPAIESIKPNVYIKGIEYKKHENAIDEEKILNKFELKKNKYFLFIGILRKYKGLDFLFPASNLVDFKIAIAGGSQPGDLDTGNFYIEESKKYKNISMLGEVSNSEKICLIKNSKGLVLPSHLRSEAFGIVLLEAAIYGKPLVSCEIETGTSFANLDNHSGIVVNPENSMLLANAMKKIYLDEELAEKFGNNARKRFDDLFTADKMGSSYLDVYEKLIETR